MEGLECAICFNAFTSSSSGNTDRTPLVFPCGHTLCQDCLTNIRRSSTQLLCPQCLRLAPSWSKNYCLIECIERQAKLNPPPRLLAAQSIPLRAIESQTQLAGYSMAGVQRMGDDTTDVTRHLGVHWLFLFVMARQVMATVIPGMQEWWRNVQNGAKSAWDTTWNETQRIWAVTRDSTQRWGQSLEGMWRNVWGY
eukprot:GHVN01075625.1.p1 GENE.GHVN01075625.1~~GHVN01075625.1.p1  ORF type:complete len:195 (+),score=16.54 GHVN01075625.1:609-1193(+)